METGFSPFDDRHDLLEERLLPEDREDFTDQNVLVISGPDAHGVSMAVASAAYLEGRGAHVRIYSGSPVINKGHGATHPGALWDKTLPDEALIDLSEVDRVVIVDVPLNASRPVEANLAESQRALMRVTHRLDKSRKSRGLNTILHPVFYLDHHGTSQFEDAWDPNDPAMTATVENPPLPPKNVESHGVVIKSVQEAERCRLGEHPMTAARIGAICDRDSATLPVSEEEMILARGLDAAVRPDPADIKPSPPEAAEDNEAYPAYEQALHQWEARAQARLNEAIIRLASEDWDYFRHEAEKFGNLEVPVASGFGDVAMIDTERLTGQFAVLKVMELALENQGIDNTPYGMAVLRGHADPKIGRQAADLVTIIRHWTRTDLPSVVEILRQELGDERLKELGVYGAENAQTMRLPVDDRETAKIVARLLDVLSGKELPDYSGIRSVVMCGDPNSGKSVMSTIFREALRTLGVKVAHLDLDKAAPTPEWYLAAEIGMKKAETDFKKGAITEEELGRARQALEDAAAKRRAMKRPWSIDLAEEAKQELVAASANDGNDFVIGDIGGGRIFKDATGKITRIQRLTAENARILSGADAVIIVSNNPAGAAEWRKLIEEGVDQETGVRIERDQPIEILGTFQSVLEGKVQKVPGSRSEAGVITNLDRSLSERKYNPSVFALATMVSEGVEHRHVHEIAEQERNPYLQRLIDIATDIGDRLRQVLPEGVKVDLGGSLLSRTALKGHNNIDMRVLPSGEWATEEGILKISAMMAGIVPYQKERPVGTPPNQRFGLMHQLNMDVDGIEGEVEIEVSIQPSEGYIGYAKFQGTFPEVLTDQYIAYKHETAGRKDRYKKVKQEFYAMTRWLFAQGYWNEEGEVVGTPAQLAQAQRLFWGNRLKDILDKPEPEI